jgi:two-component system cell cycle response regulator DivK
MPKILIVEDNIGNSKLYKDILQSEGKYEVITVQDATDILSLLCDTSPDLVIMDIMRNGISGIDAMEKIKKDGRFNHIPFLAISGNSAREYKDKALAVGFNKYMEKPIFLDVFLKTIADMINK